jgi:septal ring factor EnvC (AmiA/AmiB activator)
MSMRDNSRLTSELDSARAKMGEQAREIARLSSKLDDSRDETEKLEKRIQDLEHANAELQHLILRQQTTLQVHLLWIA